VTLEFKPRGTPKFVGKSYSALGNGRTEDEGTGVEGKPLGHK